MKTERNRSLFRSVVSSGIASLILCTPSISLGWGAGGHMMTAQIAFKRLNPKANANATKLLAIAIDPANVSAKSKDFVNASHWADDLRPFPEFDPLKPRHFIDQPFAVDGTALPADLPEADNIVKALDDNVNILRTSTDPKAQAQALRLIIHFVGDIHQPLHSATRVDGAHLEGDRGGNLVSIKVPGKDGKLKTTNLHSFWDGGIGTFPPTGANFRPPALASIAPAAATAMLGNPDTDPNLKLEDPFNFQAWADESKALAQSVAYKGIRKNARVSSAYRTNATKVARKRVAWGGYRLAALLNSIWPE